MALEGQTTGDIPILSDVFGSKPAVAPYIPTDFQAEQKKALGEDISAFPDITQLGDLYQQYMLADLNKALPGFSNLLASGGKTSQEMLDAAAPLLRGEIPQDVQDQVYRSTAYQSLMSGTAGSGMSKALTARDLGLTSLGLEQQGAQLATEGGNAAQRWAGLAEGTMLNPSSMLITPQQQAALTMQNNLYKQRTQQLANNTAAAPDPVAKGISDTIINLVGAYLGKGGGGGGTAPNYSAAQSSGLTGQTGDYGGGIGYTPTSSQYGQNLGYNMPTSANDSMPLPVGGSGSYDAPYGGYQDPYLQYGVSGV